MNNVISESIPSCLANDAQVTGTRILVCDDEAPVRELVSVLLEMAGYHVETATDGAVALQMILDQVDRYKLVLTDHKMPQLDGLGLVRELRGCEFDGKIMVLSGCLDQEDAAAYTELAVDGIMSKPFNFAEFRNAVSRLLSAHAY
ncbi:MAG: response regulator [Verrucomicrobiota bacterium]